MIDSINNEIKSFYEKIENTKLENGKHYFNLIKQFKELKEKFEEFPMIKEEYEVLKEKFNELSELKRM